MFAASRTFSSTLARLGSEGKGAFVLRTRTTLELAACNDTTMRNSPSWPALSAAVTAVNPRTQRSPTNDLRASPRRWRQRAPNTDRRHHRAWRPTRRSSPSNASLNTAPSGPRATPGVRSDGTVRRLRRTRTAKRPSRLASVRPRPIVGQPRRRGRFAPMGHVRGLPHNPPPRPHGQRSRRTRRPPRGETAVAPAQYPAG